MPIVIYDYGKCTGLAECAENCPVDILEASDNGNWCKPVDDEVENKDALDKYYAEVDSNDESDLVLRFDFKLTAFRLQQTNQQSDWLTH